MHIAIFSVTDTWHGTEAPDVCGFTVTIACLLSICVILTSWQCKTAAEETLGVLLCSEHCLRNVLDGVVNPNSHEFGYCVTWIIMQNTVWWWTRTHMDSVSAWLYYHAEDNLAVWLPSSSNATPLIHNTTERSGLRSANQTIPYIVLLLGEQNEFVEWTGDEADSIFSTVLKLSTYPFCFSYGRGNRPLFTVIQSGTCPSIVRH